MVIVWLRVGEGTVQQRAGYMRCVLPRVGPLNSTEVPREGAGRPADGIVGCWLGRPFDAEAGLTGHLCEGTRNHTAALCSPVPLFPPLVGPRSSQGRPGESSGLATLASCEPGPVTAQQPKLASPQPLAQTRQAPARRRGAFSRS